MKKSFLILALMMGATPVFAVESNIEPASRLASNKISLAEREESLKKRNDALREIVGEFTSKKSLENLKTELASKTEELASIMGNLKEIHEQLKNDAQHTGVIKEISDLTPEQVPGYEDRQRKIIQFNHFACLKLKLDRSNMLEQNSNMDKELDEKKEKLNRLKETLTKQLDKSKENETKIQDLQNKITGLQAILARQPERAQQLEEARQMKEARLEEARQMKEARQMTKAQQMRLQRLEQNVTDLEKDNQTLEQDAQRLKLIKDLSNLELRVKDADELLKKQDELSKAHKMKMEKSQNKEKAYSFVGCDAEKRLQDLQTDIEETQSNHEFWNKSFEKTQEDNQKLRIELNQITRILKEMNPRLEEVNKVTASQERQIESLKLGKKILMTR